MSVKKFFEKAFEDMKESAKVQHEVDAAEFAAVKAESKARFEEARAMGRPGIRKAAMQAKRDEKIASARERQAQAQARIDAAKDKE